MARLITLLASALCCLNYVAAEQNQLVKVDVYYESLCPDSIRFITMELAPVYNELKNFLTVNLVPFGKASYKVGSGSQPTKFNCQHGPNECQGNKAQACALHEIQKSVTADQQQQLSVKVVNCVMSNRSPATAVPECAEKNGMSQDSVLRIKSCSNNQLGDELLISMGEKTKAFQSPLTFVPSIAINGVNTPSALFNLRKFVCKQIPENQQPEICSQL